MAEAGSADYRKLPERVDPEDMVAETDVSVPPAEPEGDPDRETPIRIGLAGGVG